VWWTIKKNCWKIGEELMEDTVDLVKKMTRFEFAKEARKKVKIKDDCLLENIEKLGRILDLKVNFKHFRTPLNDSNLVLIDLEQRIFFRTDLLVF
jgi:hypothetical protein